jgi:hypothetical protein
MKAKAKEHVSAAISRAQSEAPPQIAKPKINKKPDLA